MKKLSVNILGVVTLMALLMMSMSCSGEPSNPNDNPNDNPPEAPTDQPSDQPSADEVLLRKEIAQMIVTAFDGPDLLSYSRIYRDITEYGIGGVILFEYKKNIASPEQVQKLCADLQKAAGGDLIISIDQEGGKVNRLKAKYGFPDFPSAKYLGEESDEVTAEWAERCAATLAKAGINTNFAPVVDVNVNPDCPAVGKLDRSFSSSPDVVASKAEIWVDAHHDKGVMSCLKHFPGHGSSTVDSHNGTTDITKTWSEDELIPYRHLIGGDKVDMVMVGHLFHADIDGRHPASLSKNFVDGMLREKLGFDGVVVTDDLGMGALVNNYGYDQILELAINAGVDMLCVSNGPTGYENTLVPYTIDIIYDKVVKGQIPAERIHQSAARIAKLKSRLKK